MFCFNPVNTRCCFNIYSTSNRFWNDVVCQQGRRFILCHWQKSGKPLWFAPKSKRSLKFNPLKVHQLLHIVVLLLRHGFPWRSWKGCNFHQLKEYSIKRMEELLFWLLYPIGCGSTRNIVYILQIYTTWLATNIKYQIRLLLTLLRYKHNIAVNLVF